ncbi:MAG TPA: hypothetical protein PLS51_13160 [Flavobacterium sp.]|nr:hypothetical protein [Flavobacterium sp.]HPJ11576.1 hypothetical protein [Flavobacterium sp.]
MTKHTMKTNSNCTKRSLLLLLLLTGLTAFSQQMKMSETDLNTFLCKTWKIDFVLINGKKTPFPYLAKSRMEFKPDYTFLETPVTPKSAKGNWKYNIEKNCIELIHNGRLIATIPTLSEKELIYVPVMNEESKKTITSSEMHLIPE